MIIIRGIGSKARQVGREVSADKVRRCNSRSASVRETGRGAVFDTIRGYCCTTGRCDRTGAGSRVGGNGAGSSGGQGRRRVNTVSGCCHVDGCRTAAAYYDISIIRLNQGRSELHKDLLRISAAGLNQAQRSGIRPTHTGRISESSQCANRYIRRGKVGSGDRKAVRARGCIDANIAEGRQYSGRQYGGRRCE